MFLWAPGSVPSIPWQTFLYRLHARNFHTGILTCVADNVFINFLDRSPRTFRFLSFFETIFLRFLFLWFYHGDQTIWSSRTSWRISCIWRSTSIQYVQIEPDVNSEMVPFGMTLSIDAGEDLHGFDRINWPLTSKMFTWKCLHSSCLKAVSVPTFVLGGLQGSTATSGSCHLRRIYTLFAWPLLP